ncbi:HigA family addiction module antitoxin [Adlercreutzia sp. ZJ304]|uniref:HigA family addiction module antitoxin n=1 Tax=Adlercreutzia sp. ZJ304 TaxID=2709791 RepID=UPI00197F5AD6|nr:HigA family addiction module antitoxin [Adlercreutzia sp. ZJ304]
MSYARRDDMKYMKRRPTHPGEMLREEFMSEYGLSVAELANRLGVSRQTVNELVHERRAISPNMALRLQNLFGMDAAVWMEMQQKLDLWESMIQYRSEIDAIKPMKLVVAGV